MQYALPPAAQQLVDDAFLHAHREEQARNRTPAPVALHRVPYGQVFAVDTNPQQLLVRVRDDMPIGNTIPVVVIASHNQERQDIGKVFGLHPGHTVRLVEVVAPFKVRWC